MSETLSPPVFASVSVPRTEINPWFIAVVVTLATFMELLDTAIANVALPHIAGGLAVSADESTWVLTSYLVSNAVVLPLSAWLSRLFGRKRYYMICVALFTLSSLLCGLAPSLGLLIFFRVLQGVGGGGLAPVEQAILVDTFPPSKRAAAFALYSMAIVTAPAIGPPLGGWITDHWSWRWVFFINIPLAAAVIAISLWRVPESRNADAGHVDWLGALVATVGLGGVVYGFIESTSLGWHQPLVYGSLILGFGLLIGFAFVEDRISSPMVPPALFASRGFSGANLLTLFLYAALGIFFFLFPMDLIQVQGYSTTAAGAAALPLILLLFLLSRWSGGLVTRYGSKAPLIVGPLIAALGFVLCAVPGVGAGYWIGFFPAFAVLGLGMAISVAPLTTVVMSSVAQERAGAASGINNAVARVASVLAVAILGIVMVKLFSSSLNRSLTGAVLPPGILQYVRSNEIKLAGLDLPSGLDAQTAALLRASISHAFVFGFRIAMLICASLCVASAAVATLMIPTKTDHLI